MKKAFLVTLLLLWASLAFGQRDNIDTFSVADTHEFDTVNLITLIPSFNFPGQSKSQGALVGSWQIEVPGGCYTVTQFNPGAQTFWTCSAGWYYGGQASGYTSRFLFMNTPLFSVGTNYTKTTYMMGMTTCTRWDIYGMYDADGSGHPFSGSPGGSVYSPSSCGAQTKTLTTDDNTGYTVSWSSVGGNLDITSAYDTSGNQGLSDPFGNTMTYALNGSSQLVFTDSLGAAMTQTATGQDSADPSNYQYTDANGSTQNIALTIGSAQSFVPRGSSSCVNYPSSPFTVHPVTKITYPDSTSFGITWDTNGTGISGLIGSVTLRTGGSITYTYGSIASGCGPLQFTSLTRATADGNTTYSTSKSGTTQTTTVLDPGKNKLVYTFYIGSNTFITLIDRYQNTGTVASPTYTHISETSYCYNNPSTCSTQTPSYPITQLDTYQYTYNGATQVQMSHDEKTYDSTYGLLLTDANTDSINSQTITKTIVYGTLSGGSCVALGNTHVVDRPCTITTKNGTTQLAYETVTYNANGAPTASTEWISSTDTLTTNYTANSNGTMATKTLPNGQVITNTFGGCNSLLLTDSTTTVNSVVIDNKQTWNCDAAVVTDTTDANSNEDDYAYDSMNRISSYTDRLENVTSYAYGTPTLDHVKVTDPLSVVSYVYNDGLGRPTNSQVCQTTGCSNLDTSSKSYAWNGTNFETKTYVPCVQTVLNTACTTVALTADVNPIAGLVKTTDANSGTLTGAVNSKDFSLTAGPAPSGDGENTKVLQTEIDGFGRTTSTCALEASGGTTCGQTMGNSGILTSNTYSFPSAGVSEVQTTRGSQTHTTKADSIGRSTSIATPEGGTITDVYDAISTANNCNAANATSPGNLMQHNNADSSYMCFLYDGLQRVTDVKNSVDSATSPCKRFRYDSTANKFLTAPTGYPATPYITGRLFEAETDDCAGTPTTKTDEWFAYDKNGNMTDMWEWTSVASTYYHTTTAYNADGTITSLGGIPSVSTITYAVDGEDRWNTASTSLDTFVSGVTYDAASRPTEIDIGSSTDKDKYSYDNVGNMTQYQFFVGSNNNKGVLTWNPIGSLQSLAITDGFNSNNNQTCNFGKSGVMGYDDVGRILDADCGTVWAQMYSYDQYNNMKKSGSASYNPTYSSTNNTDSFNTYDSNGNVTKDSGSNTYTWNVYGKMASENSTNFIYDAFGRAAAFNSYEYLYSPMGKLGTLSSGTPYSMAIPMPGGLGKLDARANRANWFYHYDWTGSARVLSLISGSTVNWSKSFSPYGDPYNTGGDNNNRFAGTDADTWTGITYSTPNRELAFASSRWLSPDPAHSGWNAYAYPTDPNTQTDPSGLQEDIPRPDSGNQLVTADDWAYSGMYRSGIWNNPGAQPGGIWWLFAHAPAPVASTSSLPSSDYVLSTGDDNALAWGAGGYTVSAQYNVLGDGGFLLGALGRTSWGKWWQETGCQAGKMCLGIVSPVGGGEWEAPTFTEVTPGSMEHLQALADAFAADNPEYLTAEIGCCATGSREFRDFSAQYGVRLDKLMLNGDLLGFPSIPSQEFATNPQLFYTRGIFHVVSITKDGIVVDTTAMMFRRTAPWVTPSMVYKLTP